MSIERFIRTRCGRCFSFLLAEALILSQIACDGVTVLTPAGSGGAGGGPLLGLLINREVASDVLGGIVLPDGSGAFAFGRRNPDGTIAEITGLALRDAAGRESRIVLENGRLARAVGADGSRIEMTYTVVEPLRLAGTVEIFFAQSGQTQTVPFDIDLRATAQQLADLAAQLGVVVSNDPPPDDDGRPRAADSFGPDGKDQTRAQLFLLVAEAYRFAFAIAGFALATALVETMAAVVQNLAGVVVQAVVTAAFSPFILMSQILRGAFAHPVTIVDFGAVGGRVVIPGRP